MKLLLKLIILCVLFGIRIKSAFATTWLHYSPNRYIDMDSIKKQDDYIYYLHKIYNDGRFGNNVYYSLEQSCADINKRQIKIIRITDFDKYNQIIDDYNGSNIFKNIPPYTIGDIEIEILKGYTNGTIKRIDFKKIEELLNKKKSTY